VNAPSAVWAIGGDILQPIFTGGKNRANLAASQAAYDQSVATYRESVLEAFQQVEDGLSGLEFLDRAAKTQQIAVDDSRRALEIANNRYVGGVTSYLDVITAQSTLLSNERLATQLLGQQMVTSVFLVKALGGGWDATQIQSEQVHPELGRPFSSSGNSGSDRVGPDASTEANSLHRFAVRPSQSDGSILDTSILRGMSGSGMTSTYLAFGDQPVPVWIARLPVALQVQLIGAAANFFIQAHTILAHHGRGGHLFRCSGGWNLLYVNRFHRRRDLLAASRGTSGAFARHA